MIKMSHFTLFSFFILVLASQVQGRVRKYESEESAREEAGIEVAKKKNSFALASVNEAEDLPDAEFMRKVLKGIALDLASLKKTLKKSLGSLKAISEKSSGISTNSETGGEINPPQNGISSLITNGPFPSSSGSIYTFPINPSQLNTPNWPENIGSLFDNSPYAPAIQSSTNQNLSPVLPQSGTFQPFPQLLNGMNGAPQFPGNIRQIPNENFAFQRG